jgi:hypothetical protein
MPLEHYLATMDRTVIDDEILLDRTVDFYLEENPENFTWYFGCRFPPAVLFDDSNEPTVTLEKHEAELWKILDSENSERADCAGDDEQFYDSYWGWWSKPDWYNCPIVILDVTAKKGEQVYTWDGYHRLLIARLARIKTVAVIIGVRK